MAQKEICKMPNSTIEYKRHRRIHEGFRCFCRRCGKVFHEIGYNQPKLNDVSNLRDCHYTKIHHIDQKTKICIYCGEKMKV